MPRARREKSSCTSELLAPVITETISKQAATCVASEANQGDANASKPTLTDQATMEQILAEIKSVGARVNVMDES